MFFNLVIANLHKEGPARDLVSELFHKEGPVRDLAPEKLSVASCHETKAVVAGSRRPDGRVLSHPYSGGLKAPGYSFSLFGASPKLMTLWKSPSGMDSSSLNRNFQTIILSVFGGGKDTDLLISSQNPEPKIDKKPQSEI